MFCFILCSTLLTRWRNIRLFYTTFVLTIQNRSRFEPGSPSPLFVVTPWSFFFRLKFYYQPSSDINLVCSFKFLQYIINVKFITIDLFFIFYFFPATFSGKSVFLYVWCLIKPWEAIASMEILPDIFFSKFWYAVSGFIFRVIINRKTSKLHWFYTKAYLETSWTFLYLGGVGGGGGGGFAL